MNEEIRKIMGSVRIAAGITVENMLIVFQEIATECKYTHMRLSSYVIMFGIYVA